MSEFDEWMGKKCSVIQSAYGEEYIAAQEAWDFQQAKIDNLKAQLNNMETCYTEKKKECEELQARANKALSVTGNYCDEDDAALLVFVLEKALRGES